MEASASVMSLPWPQYWPTSPSCYDGEVQVGHHSLIHCKTQMNSVPNFFVGDDWLLNLMGSNPAQQYSVSDLLHQESVLPISLPRQANSYQPENDPQGTLLQKNVNISRNDLHFQPPTLIIGHGAPYSQSPRNHELQIADPNPSNACDAHFPATTQAVASQSPEDLRASSCQDLDWEGYFQAHLPPGLLLQRLACHIVQQPWFISNEKEPPLDQNEEVVKEGHLPPGESHSRFDLFFDPNGRRRCRWVDNSERCSHEAGRLDRARGHAYAHFNYRLFACQGICGKADCQGRYTRNALLNDHLHRASRPRKTCHICQRSVTAQNLRRHMKMHS